MTRSSRPRRLLTTLAACILTLAATFAITACSNDQQVIHDQIDLALSVLQQPTQSSLQGLLSDSDYQSLSDELETLGTTPEEFCSHVFGSMTYTIDEVDVDGDEATAQLTITNKNVADAIQQAAEEYTSGDKLSEALELYASGGEDALAKAVLQEFYTILDASDETMTSSVTLGLTKTDNEWDIDDSSIEDLLNAVMGSELSSLAESD